MEFAREDDNNSVFFLHFYVGLYTFPFYSSDEAIQLSNASWSHKIKIFLTIFECMVCKFDFFSCMRLFP